MQGSAGPRPSPSSSLRGQSQAPGWPKVGECVFPSAQAPGPSYCPLIRTVKRGLCELGTQVIHVSCIVTRRHNARQTGVVDSRADLSKPVGHGSCRPRAHLPCLWPGLGVRLCSCTAVRVTIVYVRLCVVVSLCLCGCI